MNNVNDLYCPIIHGGLTINLQSNGTIQYRHCCLRTDNFNTSDFNFDFFNSKELDPLRKTNLKNIWDKDCATCRLNESSGHDSFRTGMIKGLGAKQKPRGPTRLDLQFDVGCNLACRICTPMLSSFWQKHLRDNNIPTQETYKSRADEMIQILSNMDLSDLRMVVFCGGETLLGNGYWRVAEYLATVTPNITLCFQTNGTQTISERYYELVNKFDLVKLHISLDGVGEKFEYQRWPADWNQVVDNILSIREQAPVNTMFLLEETLSIFNVIYQSELEIWHKNMFNTNRLGDVVNHTKHLANGPFSLDSITTEYYELLADKNLEQYIKPQWQENPRAVQRLAREIKQFDLIRDQDFSKTFPEVAECYARYWT